MKQERKKSKMEAALDSIIYAFAWYIFPTVFLAWLVAAISTRL